MARRIDYVSFQDIFMEIAFDYEKEYQPYIRHDNTRVTFYKTTICKDGTIERKGNISYWDTNNLTIWPKIILLAQMLMETPAEKVLYGRQK